MTPNSAERRYLRFGRFRIRIPHSRALRLALGFALLIRGMLPPAGPVLLPAALTLLSADVLRLRRMRRRLIIRLGRSRRKPRGPVTGPLHHRFWSEKSQRISGHFCDTLIRLQLIWPDIHRAASW